MILGIGYDIVELNRIQKALDRWGDKFIDKILTEKEKTSLPQNVVQYVGSRFAAKEATVKAMGTGFTMGISFRDIEVVVKPNSPPQIKLYNKAKEIAEKMKIKNIFLSISHEKSIVGAVVIFEG